MSSSDSRGTLLMKGEGNGNAGRKVSGGLVQRAYDPDLSRPLSPQRRSQPTLICIFATAAGGLNGPRASSL